MSPYTKVHNAPAALEAKLDLRRRLLEHVRPAHVFDAFCGPVGEMWAGCWRDGAASYIGIDKEYVFPDPRRRFVGDCLIVMRSISLASYNLFDFDAFGSPWDAMITLAARRRWAKGEIGGIAFTDGTAIRLSFGGVPPGISALTGIPRVEQVAPKGETARVLQETALSAWVQKARVKLLHRWQCRSRGTGGKGGCPMVYESIVFEGLGPA